MDFEQDEAIVVSTSTMKYGKGASTGIYFRFHTSAEYTNLTHPKRHQLKAWRITPERRAAVKALEAQRSVNNNNYLPRKLTGEQAKVVASDVETSLAKKAKAEQLVSKEHTQAKSFVISLFNKLADNRPATPRNKTTNSVGSQSFFTSILKKANNA